MSSVRIMTPIVMAFVAVVAYGLWPRDGPGEEVTQSEEGKAMMPNIERERQSAAAGGLLGGAAAPALFSDGSPPPELRPAR